MNAPIALFGSISSHGGGLVAACACQFAVKSPFMYFKNASRLEFGTK